MCCVVLDRDSTTTGTPNSMFRKILRHRSRKFVKLLTQPTKAACRPIATLPACSSAIRASFNWRSTSKAWTLSSISVMPSCLWKSSAWCATISAARGPLKNTSSMLRTLALWSTSPTWKDLTCAITLSTEPGAASTCRPFSFPKASTVTAEPSASLRRTSPERIVSIGTSYHALGSNASILLMVSARKASVSIPGVSLMKLR
mmetsp:Transcript_34698/g.104826  ORF Transcript_34698/g.104826 Transcript_34698/m.104826 type:complete len:202 (+) Transcript_34698:1536-2141(+)